MLVQRASHITPRLYRESKKKKTGTKTGTKTGKNREKPGKTGSTGRSSKNRETGKPGKTGKNREKPGKTGSTGHETGRAMPREFNTHIPVLWPAVGYVSVALVRASSAQTGERLAATLKSLYKLHR